MAYVSITDTEDDETHLPKNERRMRSQKHRAMAKQLERKRKKQLKT